MKHAFTIAILLVSCLVPCPLSAGGIAPGEVMPSAQRERFRNPDGSCVQCSIGMLGVEHDVPAAEMLLWDSEYGPKVRGGSGPTRVAEYCRERAIPIYNVTGSQTIRWIDWALATGRDVAITWGTNHMITAVAGDRDAYYVVDNNTPTRVDRYSRQEFLRRHMAGGSGWCVIIKGPRPVPWIGPAVVDWWNN